MSVNINVTGTASRQIVISNEQSATNIIDAVNTALTSLGWSLIDTVSSGVRDAHVTKVYAAPNNDGPNPTTKYMILRYDTPAGLWYVNACEHWNTSTNVPTNETFMNQGSFPLSLQYSNNVIYVFATARYAAFATAVRSELGPWQGVFEFEREAPEDILEKTVPCFGWTSALTIGEFYGNTTSVTTARPHSFWVPRTRNGHTGWAACQQFVINTSFGMYPPNSTQITYGSTTPFPNNHNGMLGNFGSGYEYVWDSGKKIVSSLKLAGATSAYNTGRIYGLHVIPPTGAALDTTQLPVDGNGFFSSNGTNAVHYIMSITGGALDTAISGTNRIQAVSYNSGGGQTIRNIVIINGRFVYAATNSGAFRLDLDTLLWSAVTGISGDVLDVVYDGGVNLYFSTPTGVARLNWTDMTVTALAVPTGTRVLAIDDDYLYASYRESVVTAPRMEIINLSTFTSERTFTSGAGTYSTAIPGFTDMTVDYKGFVYMHNNTSINNIHVPTNHSVWRVQGNTGEGAHVTVHAHRGGSGGSGIAVWDNQLFVMRYNNIDNWLSWSVLTATTLATVTGPNLSLPLPAGAGGGMGTKIVPFKGSLMCGSGVANVWITGLFNRATPGTFTASYGSPFAVANGFNLSAHQAVATDGVALYTGTTTAQFARVFNQAPVANNSGNVTAHILFRA